VGPDVVEEYAGRPDQDMAVLVQTEGVGPILAAERLGKPRP
jgi:endonuclease III